MTRTKTPSFRVINQRGLACVTPLAVALTAMPCDTESSSSSSSESSEVISKPLRQKKRRKVSAMPRAGVNNQVAPVDASRAPAAPAAVQEYGDEQEEQGQEQEQEPHVATGNDVHVVTDSHANDGHHHDEPAIGTLHASTAAAAALQHDEQGQDEDVHEEDQGQGEQEEEEEEDDDSGIEVVTDSDASDTDHDGHTHGAEVLDYARSNGCDVECAEDALEAACKDDATSQDRSFLEACSQDRVWEDSQDESWEPSQSPASTSSDVEHELPDEYITPDLQVRMQFSPARESGGRKRSHLLECTNWQDEPNDTNDESDFVRTSRCRRGRRNELPKKKPFSTPKLEEWLAALLIDSTDTEDDFCVQNGRCDSDIVRRTPYKDGSRQGRQRCKFERTAAVRLLRLPFPYYLLDGRRGRIRHVVSTEAHTATLRRATQKVRSIEWVRANESKPHFGLCFLVDVFEGTMDVPQIAILVREEHLSLVTPPPRLSRRQDQKFMPAELPGW